MTTPNTTTPPAGEGQPAAPAPDTPEYIANMAAKYDGQNLSPEVPPLTGDPAPKPEKPEWLPDQFWNAETGVADYEGLAKAHGELSKPKDEPPKTGDEPPKTGDESAVDFDAIAGELYGDGLTDASKAALTKLGLPEQLLGQVQEAFKAQVQLLNLQMEQHVGGKDKLADLRAWGEKNLTASDKGLIEAKISGGDWQGALDYLAFKRGQAPATTPNIMTGGTPTSGDAGFASQAEMIAAMRDPRYMNDPAYRRQVEQRVISSRF